MAVWYMYKSLKITIIEDFGCQMAGWMDVLADKAHAYTNKGPYYWLKVLQKELCMQ